MSELIINTTNINQALKIIRENKGKKILVVAKDEDFNRKLIEKGGFDVIFGFENLEIKDRLKQRSSGLNHVLCKLANKNKISIGIDFSKILSLNEFSLSNYLGKIAQNIKLCRKYRVKIIIINPPKAKQELVSFLLTLGMDTKMIKYCVNNSIKINNNF